MSEIKIPRRIQRLVRKACVGVYRQGKRSMRGHGVCAYRAEGGLMCAVGQVLTDDMLKDDHSGASLNTAGVYRLVAYNKAAGDHLGFKSLPRPDKNNDAIGSLWSRLQNLHDSTSDPTKETFRNQFWAGATSLCGEYGFDLGNPPKVPA